jgi:hypothetical protein
MEEDFMRSANTFLDDFGWSSPGGGFSPPPRIVRMILILILVVLAWIVISWGLALAQGTGGQLPGSDASDKLEAAGTLLRLVDTALFKWGARIFSGVCIMTAAWSLKEQRFGIAVICIIGAIIFGTAPSWVRNIFAISGSDSVFGIVAVPFISSLFARQTKGRRDA